MLGINAYSDKTRDVIMGQILHLNRVEKRRRYRYSRVCVVVTQLL